MLCQLAADYDKGALQMGEIGMREGVSEKYLGQIMLLLKSSGLVQSVRGAQGGYYLSRRPDAVALTEVFEILEGEILDFGEDEASETSTAAAADEVWARVRAAIRGVLDAYTLDDVAKLGFFKAGYLDYKI